LSERREEFIELRMFAKKLGNPLVIKLILLEVFEAVEK
jgi:hypothetical protein